MPFAEGLAAGQDRLLPGGGRRRFHRTRCWSRASPARGNLKIIYSPLHGVGAVGGVPGAGGGRV